MAFLQATNPAYCRYPMPYVLRFASVLCSVPYFIRQPHKFRHPGSVHSVLYNRTEYISLTGQNTPDVSFSASGSGHNPHKPADTSGSVPHFHKMPAVYLWEPCTRRQNPAVSLRSPADNSHMSEAPGIPLSHLGIPPLSLRYAAVISRTAHCAYAVPFQIHASRRMHAVRHTSEKPTGISFPVH